MSKSMKCLVKTIHILSACLWLGAAACIMLLQSLKGWSDDSRLLIALNESFSILDFALIIPAAMGSALTGLLMCRKTSWGITRYWWIITKVILTFSLILIGTALLGPWQLRLLELSSRPANGLSGTYGTIRMLFTAVGFLQVLWLIGILTISVRKPWGKRVAEQKIGAAVKPGTGVADRGISP